jgi:hypothetical protein
VCVLMSLKEVSELGVCLTEVDQEGGWTLGFLYTEKWAAFAHVVYLFLLEHFPFYRCTYSKDRKTSFYI